MKYLDKIKNNAYVYGLEVKYVAYDTLRLYSKKYNFDSWIIVETEDNIELHHLNKAYGNKNCTYHLHATFKKRKWFWSLQRINSHNKFMTRFISKKPCNLVDRVMQDYRRKH